MIYQNIINWIHYFIKLVIMLETERKKASFNKKELSHLIYGGPQGLANYLKKQSLCDADPVLKFDPSFLHQSRQDMMEIMTKKLLRIHSYNDIFPLNGSSETIKPHFLTYQTPLSLHGMMFLTTLDNLCNEEQRKLFYQPALKGEILGCYAQTELGHGSDIQRLETTATYDCNEETFIINSPTVSSAKWWIGDLGVHCTHAVVFAQLIINNKNYGLHTFLVPIRDPVTFKPLPGVEVGDIGPKHGFSTKDNGYVLIKNMKIPRKNMLMKYHVVSKEGKYSLQGDEKISYATMLMTRSAINNIIVSQFSKITTIATRYSLLRKQFKDAKGEEIPILDYQTQQAKVVSRIGECYAFVFTAKAINELSAFVYSQAKKGNFDRLNEAHVLTSATKAYLTYEGLNNSETARRSAGGHGFHLYNGMIGVQHQMSPLVTLQGQFTVMLLQVARFLFKSLVSLQKGSKLSPSIEYLQELAKGKLSVEVKEECLSCPFFVNSILKKYACVMIKNMGLKLSQGIKSGMSEKEAWDTYAGISLADAAFAHATVTVHGFYLDAVKKVQSPTLKAVLTKLCVLFGLEKLIERAGKVYETGILAPEAFQLINKKRQSLLSEIRPEALTLMEAFEYSDNVLQSAIAHSNEKPYENLIDWARRYNTINRPEERNQIIEAIKKAKAELRPSL